MGVHLGVNGKEEGGFPYDGGVHSANSEYICAVYLYAIASGPVGGDGEDTGDMGGDAVVVSGVHQPDRGKRDGGGSVGGRIG